MRRVQRTKVPATITITLEYTDAQWSILSTLREFLNAEANAGYITERNAIREVVGGERNSA